MRLKNYDANVQFLYIIRDCRHYQLYITFLVHAEERVTLEGITGQAMTSHYILTMVLWSLLLRWHRIT